MIGTPAGDGFPDVLLGRDDQGEDDEDARRVATVEPISERVTSPLHRVRDVPNKRKQPIHRRTLSLFLLTRPLNGLDLSNSKPVRNKTGSITLILIMNSHAR